MKIHEKIIENYEQIMICLIRHDFLDLQDRSGPKINEESDVYNPGPIKPIKTMKNLDFWDPVGPVGPLVGGRPVFFQPGKC